MRYSSLGPNEFSEQRVVPEFMVVDYDHTDIGAAFTLLVPLAADTLVLAVMHEVTEAFTSGGSTLSVGDSANAANWLGTNDITLGTLGFFSSSIAGGETNAKGKKYNSVDYIKLTFNALPTNGAGRLLVQMLPSMAADWRKPAAGSQTYVEPTYPTVRP